MKNYTVLDPIKHKGKIHKPGAVLGLADEIATDLLESGVIEPTSDDAPEPPEKSSKPAAKGKK